MAKVLLKGDEAIKAYENSEKAKRNAENEKFSVPVGTFIIGKFLQVEEEIGGKNQSFFVYQLLRDGVEVGRVTFGQIEKTAMWDFDTSFVKKRGAEKYYLVPNALRPMLEADKKKLEGKTISISIAKEVGYKTEFVGAEGYPNREAAEQAWLAKKAKRVYDMIIS